VLFPDGTQAVNVTPLLRRVTAPLRLIWGRADDMVPWRHALAAPGSAGLHLLPAVGHLPHLEAPDTVTRVIDDLMTCAEAQQAGATGTGTVPLRETERA
jgi:pyruvate dehydrogenase E2 component (dihydrolipoamide acetyltransferase)